MAPFSIFFSLYGLLLGLSVAVVVSGFARLLKTRPKVRPGWLVPLLGIFIMLDVTSFWNGAWRAREWMVPEYGHLFLGLVVTALYYFAASLVFPERARPRKISTGTILRRGGGSSSRSVSPTLPCSAGRTRCS